MKNISSHKGESLDVRLGLFIEIQHTLCDNLGLAFAVKHGEPFVLYDVFEGRQVEVDPKEGKTRELVHGLVHKDQLTIL